MKGIMVSNEDGDLEIKVTKNAQGFITSGLVLLDNTDQIAEHVLRANRGEYKENPLIGAEISRLINGTDDPFWAGDAKAMLQAAGLQVNKVKVIDNQIILE